MFLDSVVHNVKLLPHTTELELKVLLDGRIKHPSFCKSYFPANDKSYIIYLRRLIQLANTYGTSEITQTINFIKTYTDSMFVKQLHYENGIQIPTKKKCYIKKSLITPIYLISEDLPNLKLSISSEIDSVDINEYDIVRFKHRYTVVFSMPELSKWKLDITIVTEHKTLHKLCKTDQINIIRNIRDKMFTRGEFLQDICDKIECEFEYIGNLSTFDIDDIAKPNILFKKLYANIPYNNVFSTYSNCICFIANLLKPNLINKFKNNTYGLKQLGSSPIELTKSIYADILPNIKNFTITEKIDGIRSFVIMYPKLQVGYVLNNIVENNIKEIKISDMTCLDLPSIYNSNIYENNSIEMVILDTEEYKGIYYIFDIIYIKTECDIYLFKLPFSERKLYMDFIINQPNIQNKTFVRLTDDYTNQIKTMYDIMDKKDYIIDGIIFTSINDAYNDTAHYKWKMLSTIDFVAKKCPESLLGINPYISIPDKSLYILFSGINKNTCISLGLSRNSVFDKLFHTNGNYFPIQFSPSICPNAYLFWSDKSLDNKIVELTYTNHEWVFIKTRDDRIVDLDRKCYYGNNFKIAEFIFMNLINPITIEYLCGENISYFKEQSDVYKYTRKFNNYVKKTLIDTNYKLISSSSVIDLCSGRGQDLLKYINIGIKTIVLIDNDIDGLCEIVNRKHAYACKSSRISECYMYHLNLTNPFKESIQSLNVVNPHNKSKFVICNFALHYLIPNKSKLLNFCRLLDRILEYDGIFIFTALSGKRVSELSRTGNEWRLGSYSIKFKSNQKIDILLPFTDGKYYVETLINIEQLNTELNKRHIKLISDGSFGDFLSKFSEYNTQIFNLMSSDDKEFCSLYHYYIYRKFK